MLLEALSVARRLCISLLCMNCFTALSGHRLRVCISAIIFAIVYELLYCSLWTQITCMYFCNILAHFNTATIVGQLQRSSTA